MSLVSYNVWIVHICMMYGYLVLYKYLCVVSAYLIFGIALWSLYLSYHMRYTCSSLSFCLLFISVYFPIVFTCFRISVYPATVFVPGCPAPAPAPAPVSVKKYENKNGRAIFRSFSSVVIYSCKRMFLNISSVSDIVFLFFL